MKYLLIFGLIALASCQANLLNLDCDYVPQRNAISGRLQITFLADVTRAQGICGNEFSAYGTCCSVDSLRSKAARFQRAINNSTALLKAEFESFSNAVQNVDTQLNQLIGSKAQSDDPAFTSRVRIATLISNSRAMFFLRTNFGNASLLRSNFNANIDSCSPIVSQIRNSSLCAFCSGRSGAFVVAPSVSSSFQVVISNQDCAQVSTNCQAALRAVRTFTQGLFLYTKFLSPILMSSLGIFSDNHKVDQLGLERLYNFVSSADISGSISGNLDVNRGGVCKAVLTAGKASIFEAFAQIFQPNTDYSIFDINRQTSPSQAGATIATDNLEDNLSAGAGNAARPALSNADNSESASIAANVISRLRFFNNNRRRILQGDNTFVDSPTLQSYVDELRSVTSGAVLDSSILTPTPIVTGFDAISGDLVESYTSDYLGVLSEAGYQAITNGRATRAYDNPPADNPPTVNIQILDPVILIPNNLAI